MKLTKEIISEVQANVKSYCTMVRPYHYDEDDISQEIFLRIIQSNHLLDIKKICEETYADLLKMSSSLIVSIDTFSDEDTNNDDNLKEDTTNKILNKVTALAMLNKLKPVEKEILELHFGINGPAITNTQLSQLLGVSINDIDNLIDIILTKARS